MSPISVRDPDDWREITSRPEWSESSPEVRMQALIGQTEHLREWLTQRGHSPEVAKAESVRFFNDWRLNAIDNSVSPGEHASSELISSLSDTVFGAVGGQGTILSVGHEAGVARETARMDQDLPAEEAEKVRKRYLSLKDQKQRDLFRAVQASKYGIEIQEGEGEVFVGLAAQDPAVTFDPAALLGYAVRSMGAAAKQSARSAVEERLRQNPRLAESFLLGDVPRGVGSALGFVAGGLVGGAPAVASMGSGVQAESAYFTAKQAGASPDQLEQQVGIQGAIGASEAFGLGGLKFISKTPFGKAVSHGVGRYLFGGTKEGAQEVLAQVLVDTSEKYGGIDPERNPLDPERMARTFGVGFITGSMLTGLERSDQVILIKAQRALNKVTSDTASSVLEGSHPALAQLDRVAKSPNASAEDVAAAEVVRAQWVANARELLGSVAESEAQLVEAATVEGILEPADDRPPLARMFTGEQVEAIREASPEEFREMWTDLSATEKARVREALEVPANASIERIRAAFAAKSEGIQAEPDLAGMATEDLLAYHEALAAERGETPTEMRIVASESELDAIIAERGGVSPEASDAALAVADTLTFSEGFDAADPDIVRPADAEFGESFQVLGANWFEYRDGVRTTAAAVVRGEFTPLYVAREKAQSWFKVAIAEGTVSLDELRAERARIGQFDAELGGQAADTNEGLIEWASDLAIDRLTGKAQDSRTLPQSVKDFFAALKRWFDAVMRRAIRLEQAIAEGVASPAFVAQLDRASGLEAGVRPDPTQGLTDAEMAQFSWLRGKTEAEVDAYLAENPDVSDNVLLAYRDDVERVESVRESAVRVGQEIGLTLSIAPKRPAPRMTRNALRESVVRLDEILRDVSQEGPGRKVIKLTLSEAQDVVNGGQKGSYVIDKHKLTPTQKQEVGRQYEAAMSEVRARREEAPAKQIKRKGITSDEIKRIADFAFQRNAIEESEVAALLRDATDEQLATIGATSGRWGRADSGKLSGAVRRLVDDEQQSRKAQVSAKPVKRKAARRAKPNYATALQEDPIVSAILAAGKLKPAKSARRDPDLWERNRGDYDGEPAISTEGRAVMYAGRGGIAPDVMAQTLADQGLIRDAYPETLWEAVATADASARTVAEARAREEAEAEFRAATQSGNTLVQVNSLSVGDVLTIDGTDVTVEGVSPDGEVTLDGGGRWDAITIQPDEVIYSQTADTPIPDLLTAREGRRILTIDVNESARETFARRMTLIKHARDMDAIAAALPAELRGAVGGTSALVGATAGGRARLLARRAEKAQAVLERYAREVLLNQAERILELGRARMDDRRRARGQATFGVADQIERIEAAMKLDADDVAARLQELDGQIAEAETDEAARALQEELLITAQFGDIANQNSANLFEVVDALRDLVDNGRLAARVIAEAQRAEIAEMRERALDTITGGRGLLDSAEASRQADKAGTFWSNLDQLNKRHLGWEWLMNLASRLDTSTGTLQSFLSRRFGGMVHEATKAEERFIRAKIRGALEKQAEIYGVERRGAWAFRLGNILARRHYNKQDRTRVMRREITQAQRRVEDVPIARAADLVAGRIQPDESGRRMGLGREQVQAVRDAYAAYREEVATVEDNLLREEQALASLTDEGEVSAAKKRVAKLKAKLGGLRRRTTLKGVDLTDWSAVREVEQRLSQDQAIKITLVARQADQAENLRYWGWTPEVVEQVEAFLTPESRQLRDWLAEQYEAGYHEINGTYRREYGASLPKVPNYSPAPKIVSGRMTDSNLGAETPKGGVMSTGFISARIKNKAEPDFSTGALVEYQAHVAQVGHFISWAHPMRVLRSVFGHKDVQEALRQSGGRELNEEVQNKLQIFADGGVRGSTTIRILDRIRQNLVFTGLAWNVSQLPKQLTGAFAYLFDVPARAFFRYEAEFFANPREAIEKMWSIPFVRERFQEGYDRDVKAILAGHFDKAPGGEVLPKSRLALAIESGMIFSQVGDLSAVVIGGYAAYRHGRETYLREAVEAGEDVDSPLVQEQAEQAGIQFLERSTERVQTDGSLKGMSQFEAGGSATRLFTTFLSNARSYYQSTYQALADWKAGRKGSRKEAIRRIVVGHILLPVIYQATLDLLKFPMSDDEERDEMLEGGDIARRYLTSMALGQLSGLYLFGQGATMLARELTGGTAWKQTNPVGEAMLEIGKGGFALADALESDFSAQEIAEATTDILSASAMLANKELLAFPIAERVMRAARVDDDVSRAIWESGPEREARMMDERWDGLKRELAGAEDPKATLAGWVQSGRITRDESRSLARVGVEPREDSRESKRLRSMGVASGARAAAMRKQLEGLSRAAREEQLEAWREAGLVSPTVERQLRASSER